MLGEPDLLSGELLDHRSQPHLRGVRAEFSKKVFDRFYLINTWIVPTNQVENVMFLFWTYTERAYVMNINAIPAEAMES